MRTEFQWKFLCLNLIQVLRLVKIECHSMGLKQRVRSGFFQKSNFPAIYKTLCLSSEHFMTQISQVDFHFCTYEKVDSTCIWINLLLAKYSIFTVCLFFSLQILASAIKTCSRNAPKPSECILDIINGLRQRLATGDLGDKKTVALEPLGLDNIHFKRGPEFTASFNNLLVNGPSNFVVSKLR